MNNRIKTLLIFAACFFQNLRFNKPNVRKKAAILII